MNSNDPDTTKIVIMNIVRINVSRRYKRLINILLVHSKYHTMKDKYNTIMLCKLSEEKCRLHAKDFRFGLRKHCVLQIELNSQNSFQFIEQGSESFTR